MWGGDFNAHLGLLGGVKGVGEPNQQGILISEILDRCEMFVPSLSSIATGPNYTHWKSPNIRTTIDYNAAAFLVQDCWVHD